MTITLRAGVLNSGIQQNGNEFLTVDTSNNATLSNNLAVTGVTTLGAGAVLGTPASGNLANCTGVAVSALSTATGAAPSYSCRAWVNFNGTGTVAIRASGNVSSITDNGAGVYDVNFTTAMPDANYAPTVTAYSSSSALYAIGGQVHNQAPTTAKFRICTGAGASFGADTTSGYADLPHIFASVFR
jgi:hypothetical protein